MTKSFPESSGGPSASADASSRPPEPSRGRSEPPAWQGTGAAGTLIGLVGVVALFCAPLFVGLDGWDLRSDEALYSYGVDRILETGEWLTPRSVQVDGPFLEKPPLKFWMVAAAIRSGLVPHNEVGYRSVDALMGAVAFIYIYFIGLQLAGTVCGFVAVFVTFSMDALLFEHGLRSNNMEAPLLLAYCGGFYHFIQWVDGRRRLLHAGAVASFFVLGFMTKFVAVLFLPLVCALMIAVAPVVRQQFIARWREWLAPSALAAALIAPWFVFEWQQHGRMFIDVIFGTHVYERFTSALDPSHLAPWHFYFSRTWIELEGARVAVIAAMAALLVAVQRGRDWRLRFILGWWLVPLTLMSMGTSKLFHYAYPFLPPLALATGWGAAQLVAMADGPWGERLAEQLSRLRTPSVAAVRTTLVAGAVAALSIAMVTAINERVVWRVGEMRVFQNSSTVRPLVVAAMLLAFAGRAAAAVKVLTVVVLALVLPVSAYTLTASRVATVDAPLRVIRDCAANMAATSPVPVAGVYNTARLLSHAVYFYLYRLGPWTDGDILQQDELRRRLFDQGKQTLVVIASDGYEQLRRVAVDGSVVALPPAVVVEELVVVMPGPFSACAAAARAAGAQPPAAKH